MPTLENAKPIHVKSFFAASIQEAMDQAQQELGPDALLLNSRQAPPEAAHLGIYEVVFGSGPSGPAAAAPAAPVEIAGVEDLRLRMDEIRDLLARVTPSLAYARGQQTVVERSLVEAGVDIELAREIEESVRQRLSKRSVLEIGRPRGGQGWDPNSLVTETVAEISERCEIMPEIGRITAVVGPPGSGKTTTLVKLAVAQGLTLGRSVRLISTDTQRIGGAEQLQTYAEILGVPFQAVETAAALGRVLDSAPPEALLLIDTPGYSAAMLQDLGAGMAAFFSSRQDIDTHLILTASMRREDLRSAADRFAAFAPSKLLFTKLDETNSFGAMFSESVRLRKPLSFFCNGQSVPEDLAPADKDRITASLVTQLPEALRAVA
jgi:flagellar biosynthesis protein FlhF